MSERKPEQEQLSSVGLACLVEGHLRDFAATAVREVARDLGCFLH